MGPASEGEYTFTGLVSGPVNIYYDVSDIEDVNDDRIQR